MSVVAVCPLLVSVTDPEAAVGEVVVEAKLVGDAAMFGAVSTFRVTGTDTGPPPADEVAVSVPV